MQSTERYVNKRLDHLGIVAVVSGLPRVPLFKKSEV